MRLFSLSVLLLMVKPFHKHKVLLDENLPERQAFPNLNERFDVKHLRDDLNSGGLKDHEVYALAKKQNRLLVTYNVKDFKHRISPTDTEILPAVKTTVSLEISGPSDFDLSHVAEVTTAFPRRSGTFYRSHQQPSHHA
jgi:hypothetical protein